MPLRTDASIRVLALRDLGCEQLKNVESSLAPARSIDTEFGGVFVSEAMSTVGRLRNTPLS